MTTNFEKIKAMEIEKMIDWIINNTIDECNYCIYECCPFYQDHDCKTGIKQWLESESE